MFPADADTGTAAVLLDTKAGTAIFGSPEALVLAVPSVVAHVLNLLPAFTKEIKPLESSSALNIIYGHSMRIDPLTQNRRMNNDYTLPTFLELQSDFHADFAIAKQVSRVNGMFADFVLNLTNALHDRSRHLVLGLCIGKDAYTFGLGRIKFSITQCKSAKERDLIIKSISHYQTHEISIQALLLTPPMKDVEGNESGISCVDDMKKMCAEFGIELQTTHPDEVAEMAVEGLQNDAFWLLATTPDTEEKIRARADMILNRETPVPVMVGA